MVAGMNSSANFPLNRRRNPHRTCRSASEVLTELNKPVSANKTSFLHGNGNSREVNLAESFGKRTTENKKDKPQARNQRALPDSLTCLKKSSRQLRRINGHVSSKSPNPEPTVPKKNATPKCESKTLHKGRKKKNIQTSQNKVAASKDFSDGLDNSTHNSFPGQHSSSQKTKGTHYRHSKKTQNHQTPSDVSTGFHTCTTVSSRRHTNRPHSPIRVRLRSSPLLCSTPNSSLPLLSPKRAENLRKSRVVKKPPAATTPSRRVRNQRFVAAGRPRGRKKKNIQEQLSVSPPAKRGRKRKKPPGEFSQEEPSVDIQTQSRPGLENQEPEKKESVDQSVSSNLSIELSLQEEPHPLNGSLFMQEEEEDQDDDEEELPSFLRLENKKPLSISEGQCVWCKMRKYPYWPAVVKSVNHKSKKASIVFIDCFLIDHKRVRKGFYVSLRTLKPFDCEEYEKLVDMAKEKYGNAITWSLELISDYRIRIGCGSFSGSFIEYCAADISCPVRRKYSEGKSVLTFPSQEILGEQCDMSDHSTEDIIVEEQDELFFKKVLPDRTKAARNRANKKLVDFIIRRNVENRLLAVISGHESSKWMQALHKPNHSRHVVDVYLEDEEQVDKVYRYLNKVCESAPQINSCLENIQVDRIRLILDVLLPEAIIYAIAGVDKLSLEKAEQKYLRGPCFSNRERQEFDMMIEQQMKLNEITHCRRQ